MCRPNRLVKMEGVGVVEDSMRFPAFFRGARDTPVKGPVGGPVRQTEDKVH